MLRRSLLAATALAAMPTILVAGCSSSGGPSAPPATGQRSSDTAAASSTAVGSSTAHGSSAGGDLGQVAQLSVRYANFFDHKGVAGPAVDIYESPTPDHSTVLIRDLAYGAVSSYVHPHLMPKATATDVGVPGLPLFAVPAGENPTTHPNDVKPLTQLSDDGSHAQLTVLLRGEKDTDEPGPLGGLSSSTRLEKGTFNGQKTLDIPPAGTPEILADASSVTEYPVLVGEAYLMIGNSCTPPVNGDPNLPNLPAIYAAQNGKPQSLFAVFPVSAGAHQVSISETSTDVQIDLTCAKLTKRQSPTTVTVAAGRQLEVYVYGPTPTDLHLVAVPVGA